MPALQECILGAHVNMEGDQGLSLPDLPADVIERILLLVPDTRSRWGADLQRRVTGCCMNVLLAHGWQAVILREDSGPH